MIKQQEISAPTSCLNSAENDEPLFVLRANDELAPEVVRLWIALSMYRGLHTRRLEEATRLADEMDRWKATRGQGHSCREVAS